MGITIKMMSFHWERNGPFLDCFLLSQLSHLSFEPFQGLHIHIYTNSCLLHTFIPEIEHKSIKGYVSPYSHFNFHFGLQSLSQSTFRSILYSFLHIMCSWKWSSSNGMELRERKNEESCFVSGCIFPNRVLSSPWHAASCIITGDRKQDSTLVAGFGCREDP